MHEACESVVEGDELSNTQRQYRLEPIVSEVVEYEHAENCSDRDTEQSRTPKPSSSQKELVILRDRGECDCGQEHPHRQAHALAAAIQPADGRERRGEQECERGEDES